eukprot:PhF_6_TR40337/c1_g1_i2/m.59981
MSLFSVQQIDELSASTINTLQPFETSEEPATSKPLIEYQIPLNIKIGEIYFYQNYIRGNFTNGKSLLDTIQSLESGAIKPQDIPSIEALHWRGKWYGMGNRRLACYHYVYRD